MQAEVTISDGGTGTHTLVIPSPGGSVTFNNGAGAPGEELDLNSNNRTYTISVKVTTSLCPDGVTFIYAGRYIFGL